MSVEGRVAEATPTYGKPRTILPGLSDSEVLYPVPHTRAPEQSQSHSVAAWSLSRPTGSPSGHIHMGPLRQDEMVCPVGAAMNSRLPAQRFSSPTVPARPRMRWPCAPPGECPLPSVGQLTNPRSREPASRRAAGCRTHALACELLAFPDDGPGEDGVAAALGEKGLPLLPVPSLPVRGCREAFTTDACAPAPGKRQSGPRFR